MTAGGKVHIRFVILVTVHLVRDNGELVSITMQKGVQKTAGLDTKNSAVQ